MASFKGPPLQYHALWLHVLQFTSAKARDFPFFTILQLDSFSQRGYIVPAACFPVQLRSTRTRLSSERKQVRRHDALL